VDTLFIIAINLSVIILIVLAVFQLYWALGGNRFLAGAWGGTYTVLPLRLRISSGFSVLMFTFAIALVLIKVGTWHTGLSTSAASWALLAFAPIFLLSSLANFASKSKWERYLNAPTSLLLAVMFLFIALNQYQGND